MKVVRQDREFEWTPELESLYKSLGGTQKVSYYEEDYEIRRLHRLPSKRDEPALIEFAEILGRIRGAECPIVIEDIPNIYSFGIDTVMLEGFGNESIYLTLEEDFFRVLIRTGTEDEIVNYVKRIGEYV